jgi:hemolysin activation/secretion protein
MAVAQEKQFDRFKPKEPIPLAKEKELKPEAPVQAQVPGNAQVTLKLRGIIFVGSMPQIRVNGAPATEGILVEGVPMLNRPDFAQRMQKFIGEQVSLDLINAIAAETARYYKEHDHPVVSVVAPQQDVTNGVVQLLVTEARLGQVREAGNKWFKSSLFKTRLKPGDPIIMSRLEADTAFYDRNPFRSVTAELSPGKNSGETDVTLRVQDKFPLRVFAGYDNSGVESTGENRLFAGFNYGNLFGLGQELSYQFSTSDDFEKLLAHSATWTIPLPWHDVLQFSGTYSESRPDLGEGFDMTGTSWEIDAHYIVILPNLGRYKHELTLGYNFKFTDNNLQFGGEQVFDTPVEISQFSLAYSGSLPDTLGRTAISLASFWSPGGMSSHNNDEDFDAARQDSDAQYFYATLGLDRITRLPLGLTWSLSARGQLASGNLQATEQFLLGGESTVRGYPELIAAGDEGILVRNEIYSPSFSIAKLVGFKGAADQLQFLAFYDFGITSIKHPLEGEDKRTQLSSCGVGARWQVRQNLTAFFDYGWQIDQIGEDHSRAHVGVTASF